MCGSNFLKTNVFIVLKYVCAHMCVPAEVREQSQLLLPVPCHETGVRSPTGPQLTGLG